MNVYELQLEGIESEPQLHAARWELFVCPEIRDVVRLGNGHLAILYEGEPDTAHWLGVLEEAGYLRALAA